MSRIFSGKTSNLILLASALATTITLAVSSAQAEPGVDADVSLTPVGDFKAHFGEVKGEATQQGDSVTAENIVIDLKGIKTGLTLRDRHARDKYLEVEKFPVATLLKASGKGGKGEGRLKLKDIEKDISGTYEIKGSELVAEFKIKLSDFKITDIKYLGIGVDDTVVIHVTVPLKK
jgi:polyisoprenoid-binding protein YceI